MIAGAGGNATAEALAPDEGARGRRRRRRCCTSRRTTTGRARRGCSGTTRAIAKATKLPIILYNVPTRTACDMLPETVVRLADFPEHRRDQGRHRQPGARPTSSSRRSATACTVRSGDDGTAFPLYARRRARGVISVVSNVAPKRDEPICGTPRPRGDWERARKRHHQLRVLSRMLFAEPSPAPAKAALALLGPDARPRCGCRWSRRRRGSREQAPRRAGRRRACRDGRASASLGPSGRMGRAVLDTAAGRTDLEAQSPRWTGPTPGLGAEVGGPRRLGLVASPTSPPGSTRATSTSTSRRRPRRAPPPRSRRRRKRAAVIGTTGLGAPPTRPRSRRSPGVAPRRRRRELLALGVNLPARPRPHRGARPRPDWDAEVVETHHRAKRDAPSGTALTIAREIAAGRGTRLRARSGASRRDGDSRARAASGEIGVSARPRRRRHRRAHRVLLRRPAERIEIGHRATVAPHLPRRRRAARRATWVVGKPPGRATRHARRARPRGSERRRRSRQGAPRGPSPPRRS